jgi:hypothetical protein
MHNKHLNTQQPQQIQQLKQNLIPDRLRISLMFSHSLFQTAE